MEKYQTECPKLFNLGLSLDCGQAFRWREAEGKWRGTAFGKTVEIEQTDGKLIFCGCGKNDFENIWKRYFDLERDYEKIVSSYDDEYLQRAVGEYKGIRILRQEPWEALCSFIISQNNNIPRIKGIISRLCESFGESTGQDFAFPTAEKLAGLTAEDLAPLRAGFRAKYIIDAAQKVSDGTVDFKKIEENPIELGRTELQKSRESAQRLPNVRCFTASAKLRHSPLMCG